MSERDRAILLEVRRRGLVSAFSAESMPEWMQAHEGQLEAWGREERFLALVAGWQSGKTDFLPWWCLREAARTGPGDALVLAPTYPLLIRAARPRFLQVFGPWGHERKSENCFIVPEASLRRLGWTGKKGDLTVYFGHTSDEKAVEATTANWIAADEAGQMPDPIWDAMRGRVSATGGRVLLCSRPYFDNWYRTVAEESDPDVGVVSFPTWANPGHDPEHVERERRVLPGWKFQMRYGGVFTRPAGAILEDWGDEHEVAPFVPPASWKRFAFVDFGQVHTFVALAAEHPKERDSDGYPVLYVYREHFPNRATVTFQHVRAILDAEAADCERETGKRPEGKPRAIGGAPSEDRWRTEWAAAGLPVERPLVKDMEPQIDRLVACVRRGGLKVTKDCPFLLKQMRAWSWELDDGGEPIPGKVKDDRDFHGPAALRYGVSQLRPGRPAPEKKPDRPPIGSLEWHRQMSKPRRSHAEED